MTDSTIYAPVAPTALRQGCLFELLLPDMNLQTFASKHHLSVSRHEDGELVIKGKMGHFFDYDRKHLAFLFMPDPECRKPAKPKIWHHRRRMMESAGMVCLLDAEDEGIMLFDPADKIQYSMAIKIAKLRSRRAISTEESEKRKKRMAKARAARKKA